MHYKQEALGKHSANACAVTILLGDLKATRPLGIK